MLCGGVINSTKVGHFFDMLFNYSTNCAYYQGFIVILYRDLSLMKTFEELGVSEEIRRSIEEMGYAHPMPVQEAVIPYLLGVGNDVIALAQTGTGKTAAFGLPILQKVDVHNKATQAIILSPTRELCLQIADDLKDYSRYIDGSMFKLFMEGAASIAKSVR